MPLAHDLAFRSKPYLRLEHLVIISKTSPTDQRPHFWLEDLASLHKTWISTRRPRFMLAFGSKNSLLAWRPRSPLQDLVFSSKTSPSARRRELYWRLDLQLEPHFRHNDPADGSRISLWAEDLAKTWPWAWRLHFWLKDSAFGLRIADSARTFRLEDFSFGSTTVPAASSFLYGSKIFLSAQRTRLHLEDLALEFKTSYSARRPWLHFDDLVFCLKTLPSFHLRLENYAFAMKTSLSA